jgi:hypothetical protein
MHIISSHLIKLDAAKATVTNITQTVKLSEPFASAPRPRLRISSNVSRISPTSSHTRNYRVSFVPRKLLSKKMPT